MIGGLVLAAGAGKRFGGRKQLALLDGRPLLEHVLYAMERAPVAPVVVVLGAHTDEILGAVDLHGAEPVACPDWKDGLAASLRAGVAALAGAEAVVVALGDQPFLDPDAIARVLGARGDGASAVRATYDGLSGHPVLLERRLFARLSELTGDRGAAAILSGEQVRDVPCDGLGRPDDIDTPEALEVLTP